MKKKYLLATLCIVFGLTACGNTESNTQEGNSVIGEPIVQKESVENNNQDMTNVSEKNKESEKSEASEKSEGSKNAEGTVEPGAQEQLQEPYEAFLGGEASLYFDNYNLYAEDENGFRLFFTEGQPYAIKELSDLMETYVPFREEKVSGVYYSYIDCGMDGIPELFLKVATTGDNYGFIIKDIDGKLQTCYAFEEAERSSVSVSESGIIFRFGSNGATSHSLDYSVVDKDGQYHFGYTMSYVSGDSIWNYSRYIDVNSIDPVLLENTEIDELYFEELKYWLEPENPSIYEDWLNQKRYYAYYDLRVDTAVTGDEPMYQEGSEYANTFWNDHMEFVRPDQFQALMDQRRVEIGITGDIETSREPELLEWEQTP